MYYSPVDGPNYIPLGLELLILFWLYYSTPFSKSKYIWTIVSDFWQLIGLINCFLCYMFV